MKRPFFLVGNGRMTTIPKSWVKPDGEEPGRAIDNPKVIEDFTRVCDETGILNQSSKARS